MIISGALRPALDARSSTTWLLAVLAAGVALRSGLGSRGSVAGLVMAAVLGVAVVVYVSADAWRPPRIRPAAFVWGAAGAVVLTAGPLVAPIHPHPAGAFAPWAAAVTVVVAAEEAFLRGALWNACARWGGGAAALVITTAAFAGMHVPVYGWHSVPLDLLVGVVLGALRLGSGTVVAPLVAHLAADWAGWWLA